MSKSLPWTVQEDINLISFLSSKAENAKSPLTLTYLCKEFKDDYKSSRTKNGLIKKVKKFRLKIRDMRSLDTDTKVKMIFALSAPIDNLFFTELQKEADVKLDEHNRIIEYEKRGGGLKLSGVHVRNRGAKKELMEFLAEKSKDATSPFDHNEFVKEFQESSGTSLKETTLQREYRQLKTLIYTFTEYDEPTKIKMMFLSGARINENILEKLRKDASVKINREQQITEYKAHDGSLELEGYHGWNERNEENRELINFIAEKSKQASSPFSFTQLSEDVIKNIRPSSKLRTVIANISNCRHNITKLDNFDTDTKVRMAFLLGAPIDQNYLNELRKNARVEVDNKQRITKYASSDGKLKLKGNHSRSAKFIKNKRKESSHVPSNEPSKEITGKMMKFLVEKSENATSPITNVDFVKEFKAITSTPVTESILDNSYRLIKNQIYNSPEYDKATKVRMMFVSGTRIYTNILKEIREDAVVEVDEMKRIIEYKRNDGSLQLKGEHYGSKTAKINAEKAEKRKERGQLINFIVEKSKQAKSPLCVRQMSKEFVEMIGSSRDVSAVEAHIHSLHRTIPELVFENTETSVRVMFAMSIPISKNCQSKLSKFGRVVLDEKQRIMYYEAYDGNLELKGAHSLSESDYEERRSIDSEEEVGECSSNSQEYDNQPNYQYDFPIQRRDYSSEKSSNKRKLEYKFESLEQKASKKYKQVQSESTKDVIFDGPGEPIPAELPVKREPNIYDELFWQQKECKPELMYLIENPVPVKQEEPEYEEQIFQEERYQQEPMKSSNVHQYTQENDMDGVKLEDSQFLVHPVKKEEIEDPETISDTQLVTINSPPDPSLPNSSFMHTDKNETSNVTSGKSLLKLLRSMVCIMKSSTLADIQVEIEQIIEKLGDDDYKTSIDDILLIFETNYRMITKYATVEPLKQDSRRLSEYLLLLQNILLFLDSPVLHSLQLEVTDAIKELLDQDMIIPIEKIQLALEATLEMISSI